MANDETNPLLNSSKPYFVLQHFPNRFWIGITILGAIFIATIIGLSVHSSDNDDSKDLKLLHVVRSILL